MNDHEALKKIASQITDIDLNDLTHAEKRIAKILVDVGLIEKSVDRGDGDAETVYIAKTEKTQFEAKQT